MLAPIRLQSVHRLLGLVASAAPAAQRPAGLVAPHCRACRRHHCCQKVDCCTKGGSDLLKRNSGELAAPARAPKLRAGPHPGLFNLSARVLCSAVMPGLLWQPTNGSSELTGAAGCASEVLASLIGAPYLPCAVRVLIKRRPAGGAQEGPVLAGARGRLRAAAVAVATGAVIAPKLSPAAACRGQGAPLPSGGQGCDTGTGLQGRVRTGTAAGSGFVMPARCSRVGRGLGRGVRLRPHSPVPTSELLPFSLRCGLALERGSGLLLARLVRIFLWVPEASRICRAGQPMFDATLPITTVHVLVPIRQS